MIGYVKLFQTILTSSIWQEDNETRLVWITMLALKDKNGLVVSSVSGLAHMARVPLESCQRALVKLTAPDGDSRTKEHQGRRVEAVDGGWQVLNHAKYRDMMKREERTEYNRVKKAESRQRGNPPKRIVRRGPGPVEQRQVREFEAGTRTAEELGQ